MVRSFILAVVLVLVAGCGQGATPDDQRASQKPDQQSGKTSAPSDTSEQPVEPSRLVIPDIDVRADMVEVGLNDDGSMETPEYDRNQTGWYAEGPPPGAPGSAVVVGHLDSDHGDDVFADLADLDRGDEISVVDEAGDEHSWRVDRLEQIDKDSLPYEDIWVDTDKPLLRLVTCAGKYVEEYEDNLVVYAEPA